MLPSFATCLKVFKTVFVFAVRPFLPMSVLFFGFNGIFNGGTENGTSGARIKILRPLGHFPIEIPIEAEK